MQTLSFKQFVYQRQSLAAQESPGGFSFTLQELNAAISWRELFKMDPLNELYCPAHNCDFVAG